MAKFLSLALIIIIGYCFWSFNHVPTRERKDLSAELQDITVENNLGRVLIIYYSLNGNTYNIASRIQKMTHADMLEIKTIEEYPSSPAYFWITRQQLKNNDLPKLQHSTLDISSYDIIIIGSPVWWYTIPAPILSLLAECDFSGKTVTSFVTHGGNVGSFFSDFRKKIKNAKVIDGIDFKDVVTTQPKVLNENIAKWLNELELRK